MKNLFRTLCYSLFIGLLFSCSPDEPTLNEDIQVPSNPEKVDLRRIKSCRDSIFNTSDPICGSYHDDIYDYNANGSINKISRYTKGVLKSIERYVYNAQDAIVYMDSCANGLVISSRKMYKIAFCSDFIRTNQLITYAYDGVTESIKIETNYDTQGRTIGLVGYDKDKLDYKTRDYVINGTEILFYRDNYNDRGEVISTVKQQLVYTDDWLSVRSLITYNQDNVSEFYKKLITYDSTGRYTDIKEFSNGALFTKTRDLVWNGKEVRYVKDISTDYDFSRITVSDKYTISYY